MSEDDVLFGYRLQLFDLAARTTVTEACRTFGGWTKGAVWQLSAIGAASSFAWAELVSCPPGDPVGEQTSKLARRVAGALRMVGWRLERVLTDRVASTAHEASAPHSTCSPPDAR